VQEGGTRTPDATLAQPGSSLGDVLALPQMTDMDRHRSTMSELKDLLQRHEARADKRLGQHFLVDRGILRSIAAAAFLSKDDTVIEVGPGTGLLTSELCAGAGEVIAVELDARMVHVLQESLREAGNLVVVQGDILGLPPDKLLEQHSRRQASIYKVVANLPYYITSPVLRHFLHAAMPPRLMVVMVQEEVGRAILAAPGEMSLLSVSVQAFSRPSIVRRVTAQSFHPRPKVDSLVLKLEYLTSPAVEPAESSSFLDFVAAGFHSPRKQLHNSFGHGLSMPREQIADMLQRGAVDATRRPETLTIDEWGRLWRIYRDRPRSEEHEC